MPRGRMLSQSISSSPTIESMSEWAQLLFDRIVIHADDHGRMEATPTVVKAKAKPMSKREPYDFAKAIAEMISVKALTVYTLDDRTYLFVQKNEKHQSLKKPAKSKLPAPDEGQRLTAMQYLAAVGNGDHSAVGNSSLPAVGISGALPGFSVKSPESSEISPRREEKKKEEVEAPPVVPPSGDAQPRKRQKKAVTFMTPEWQPTPEVIEEMQAECPAIDVVRAIPEFRDYWLGEGKPKANWDATFRNRIRKLDERRHGNGKPRNSARGTDRRGPAADAGNSTSDSGPKLGRFRPRRAD